MEPQNPLTRVPIIKIILSSAIICIMLFEKLSYRTWISVSYALNRNDKCDIAVLYLRSLIRSSDVYIMKRAKLKIVQILQSAHFARHFFLS